MSNPREYDELHTELSLEALTLEKIIESADKLKDLDQMLKYADKLSRWSILRNERQHHAYIFQLKRAVQDFEYCQRLVQQSPAYKMPKIVHDLEQSMSSAGGLCQQLMKLCAQELEHHLDPVPSYNDLDALFRELHQLSEVTFKEVALEYFASRQLYPKRECDEAVKKTVADQDVFHECCEFVNVKLLEIFNKLAKNQGPQRNGRFVWYDGKQVVGTWLYTSLRHAVDSARVGFLCKTWFLSEELNSVKALMPWTILGPVIETMLECGALEIGDCHADPQGGVKRSFEEVGTIVFPKCVEKLST